MKVIPEWRAVLKQGLSMWAAYGAAIFQVLDQIQPSLVALLPQLQGRLPEHALAWVSWVCVVLVPILRVIDQGIAATRVTEAQRGH